MVLERAVRAWLGSVVACVAVLAASIAGTQLLTGRTNTLLHNVVDVSIAFGAVFAVTAALIHVPAFGVLESLLRQPLRRPAATLLGAALAPTAYVAVAWRFREWGDPQTVTAWLAYWASHIPWLAIGSVPFAIAGTVFGFLWSGPARR